MARIYIVYAAFLVLMLIWADLKGTPLSGMIVTHQKWGAQGPAFNHK